MKFRKTMDQQKGSPNSLSKSGYKSGVKKGRRIKIPGQKLWDLRQVKCALCRNPCKKSRRWLNRPTLKKQWKIFRAMNPIECKNAKKRGALCDRCRGKVVTQASKYKNADSVLSSDSEDEVTLALEDECGRIFEGHEDESYESKSEWDNSDEDNHLPSTYNDSSEDEDEIDFKLEMLEMRVKDTKAVCQKKSSAVQALSQNIDVLKHGHQQTWEYIGYNPNNRPRNKEISVKTLSHDTCAPTGDDGKLKITSLMTDMEKYKRSENPNNENVYLSIHLPGRQRLHVLNCEIEKFEKSKSKVPYNIMNACVTLLGKKDPSNQRAVVFDSSIFTMDFEEGMGRIRNKYEKLAPDEYKPWILPLLVDDNNHWIVVCIDWMFKELQVYDPYGQKIPDKVMLLTRIMSSRFDKQCSNGTKIWKPKPLEVKRKQVPLLHSGFYCFEYMESFLFGDSSTLQPESDIADIAGIRQKMLALLRDFEKKSLMSKVGRPRKGNHEDIYFNVNKIVL